MSLNSNNGGSGEVVTENPERCDGLPIMLILKYQTEKSTYWVVDCIAVPNSCRENWVNTLIHCLKGVHVWIGPRQL